MGMVRTEGNISKTLPDKSEPKIIALESATDMQCHNELSRKLVLIRAVITPSLESPSHIQTNSGQDSRYRATVSPFLKPCDLK